MRPPIVRPIVPSAAQLQAKSDLLWLAERVHSVTLTVLSIRDKLRYRSLARERSYGTLTSRAAAQIPEKQRQGGQGE